MHRRSSKCGTELINTGTNDGEASATLLELNCLDGAVDGDDCAALHAAFLSLIVDELALFVTLVAEATGHCEGLEGTEGKLGFELPNFRTEGNARE